MKRFSISFVLALWSLTAPAGPPSEEDLASAVADLGHENPAVRAEAKATILRWAEADPEALGKVLPATAEDPEARALLAELHETVRERISILRRKDRVMEAAGKDEALRTATERLLASLADPAFLAPAAESAVRLPETDDVLTPYVTGTYESGKPGVARVMEALLVDGSLAVRRIAARILYYHGSAANEKALVAAMKDKDPYIRGCGALTLSHYGVKSAVPAIKEMLKDPDPQVQLHAQMALEELGSAIEPEELRRMLKSQDAGVRRRAVQMFVLQGDPAALEHLAPLLDDPDGGIRTMVADAMAALGGFAFDPEEARLKAAREWWEKKQRDGAGKK
ncbi:MAG: PBS lyase HEAT domain-containing protein repeat-containing [Planctomycetota bacterium]|nr:MAG: PBS lyase HEAT domain-containing protein repeat-containing [Planctomycetota bacterium]